VTCEGCQRMRRFLHKPGGYCRVLGVYFLRPLPAHTYLACGAKEVTR